MPVPLKIQLFDAFLGSQEGIHSLILPDIFSSGGSKNLYIDKYGRAKKILGYAKQNSAAITTDTGGSTAKLRGLFPYRSTSGGSVGRILMGVFDDGTDEWEIWKSTDSGVNWTFVVDVGAAPINQVPDFAQFGDILYIATGKTVPFRWNGTVAVVSGQTQSPTPTSASSGTAGFLSGIYKWKLVTVNADGTRKYGSAASAVLFLASKQGSLTWTIDADATAKGYEVYRTTGNGDTFYYVDYVDLRATAAYTDNIADLTILQNRVMEEHGDPPPAVYFAEPHKQRMWWLRSDTYPTRGWFSDPALPESTLQSSNYIDFSDSETVGDFITGGLGNFEGQFIVFTERAVWAVSGTGQVIGNIVDWSRIRTNAQVGTVSHRSVVRVPAGSKYTDQNGQPQVTPTETLAYFTPQGDIRLFDGNNDLIISHPVKTSVATFNYTHRQKIVGLHDTSRAEITWMYPGGSSNVENSTAVTWNYRWGVWYIREWGFASACEADETGTAQVLLAGSGATGRCYKLWSGSSFDGAAIAAQWMTKTLYGVQTVGYKGQPALSSVKRWRWADFLFETDQTVTLTVEWLQGNTPDNGAAYGTLMISPSAATLLDADGDTIASASGDTIIVSQASSLSRAILHNSSGRLLHHEGIRLRVGDNASLGSWSLEGFNLAYQEMPGLGRRMQGER